MRSVFETMGTVASLEVPQAYSSVLPSVESVFREFDERFSLYRPESELSSIASGGVDLPEASPILLASYERSILWRNATAGLFTPHRPDGVLDLNGIVKAEAIERAGALLDESGCPAWSLNVGGDVLVRSDDEPWMTGIVDPTDTGSLLCSITLGIERRAVATSGSAERGEHIWRGGDPRPPEFLQVTVVADDIVTADVLATAIVSGGRAGLDELTAQWPIDVLTVLVNGELLATPNFPFARAAVG